MSKTKITYECPVRGTVTEEVEVTECEPQESPDPEELVRSAASAPRLMSLSEGALMFGEKRKRKKSFSDLLKSSKLPQHIIDAMKKDIKK